MDPIQKTQPDPAHVLGKAITQIGTVLNLTDEELGKILHKNRNTVLKMRQTESLNPDSSAGEFALLLGRVHRSIYALEGGDPANMQYWLKNFNHHLNDVPLHKMHSVQGLVEVVMYLDAMRAKI